MNRLFVGRHGRVDDEYGYGEKRAETLSAKGVADAHRMAETLKNLGISRRALLLSSVAPRAVQTARIIRADLGTPTLVRSPFITRVGNRPEPVQDLRGFSEQVLEACKVDHADMDVAMIAHLPLVRAVAMGRQQDGGVYEVHQDWKNPTYVQGFEILLGRPDQWYAVDAA